MIGRLWGRHAVSIGLIVVVGEITVVYWGDLYCTLDLNLDLNRECAPLQYLRGHVVGVAHWHIPPKSRPSNGSTHLPSPRALSFEVFSNTYESLSRTPDQAVIILSAANTSKAIHTLIFQERNAADASGKSRRCHPAGAPIRRACGFRH